MNFLFAWRYFKAKKTTNAINIIAWISVVAITLITAAFVVLLSVFNGFEGLVKSLYSSFYSDIRISSDTSKVMIVTAEQLKKISALKDIKAFSKVAEEKALLQNGDLQTIVFLKGVDEQYEQVSGVPQKIIRGKFELGNEDKPSIVLGGGIEHAVAVDVEKSIYPMTVYLFRRGVGVNVIDPYQSFAADNITGAGTFFIQQDIDSKYALTNIDFMKRMLQLKEDEYGSIDIALNDPELADDVKNQLKSIFPSHYKIESRYQQNQSLYSVMALEKWAIYGILTLMLIVAAFTMVGALTMLVLEKEKDIQVLKAIGASNRLVQKIFLSEGVLLGGIGVVSGLILGLLLCWLQTSFRLVAIQGGTFLIDYYPIYVSGTDLLLVAATVFIVAILASWFPSRRAALQQVELKS
ncbi:MAG: ABC transporter permease [Chitinophagaceae bacterium]|nr:ABC transporter permease [Chitinophagaceae bacterium]